MEEVPGVWFDEPDAVLPRLPGAALLLPQSHALAGQQAVGGGQQACAEGLRAARLLQARQLLLPSIQGSQVRLTDENNFHEVYLIFWKSPAQPNFNMSYESSSPFVATFI